MNWKLIFIGGLAYYLATMIIGFGVTGPLIHEGVLDATYQETEMFWRPELRTEPPDLGALMPRWLTAGLISSLIIAAIFGCVASSLGGVNLKGGLYYGIILATFGALSALGWSGVFNLPDSLWAWWTVDGIVIVIPAGAAMGWAGGKFAA